MLATHWVLETLASRPAPWTALAVASVTIHRSGGAPMGDLQVRGISTPRGRVFATRAGVVRRLGRVVLWLLVLVLLLRGLASVVGPQRPAVVAATATPAATPWPDDGARAFASDFARAYLTYNATDPDASAAAIRAFVGPELASSIAPEYNADAPPRAVGSVAVARVERVDGSHAVVTVAAAATGGTQYLSVPVARDGRGGLVVSDLPSLS